jgi:type II secretory pathway pseudopilin PulG
LFFGFYRLTEKYFNMKLSIVAILSTLAVTSAFAPSAQVQKTTVALNAESSRKAFLSAAAMSVFAPAVANAGTMGQELVTTPTEQWETGVPNPPPPSNAKFANARTQMTSSFPPIKRLTLEKKSPVTRLDINAPNFTEYKKTLPGLYKTPPSK